MIMTGSSLAPPRATVFAPLQILLVHDIARALGHLVVEPLSRLVGLVGYPIDAAQPRRPRLGADRLDQRAPHALAARRLGGEEVLQVRSEEHTSELQSLMRISYAVVCLKKITTSTLTN